MIFKTLHRFLHWLRARFHAGSVARNAATLGVATALSQVLSLLLLPVVTRLYTPMDFGVFSAFVGITAILSVIVCGRYEMAIVLPKSTHHARHLLLLCLILAAATSGLTLIGTLILAYFMPQVGVYSDLTGYAPLIGISMFCLGVKICSSYWLTRLKLFRDIGFIEFTNVLLIIVLQILYGVIFGPDWFGLVLSMTVTQALIAVLRIAKLFSTGAFELKSRRMLLLRLRILARLHLQLPLFSMPAGLMNTAGHQSLVILMPLYFTTSVVGHLALAMRAVRAPVQLLGGSLGQVLTQRLAHNVANGVSNVPIIVRTVRWLALASLTFALPLLFWSNDLFALAFGEQWRETGTYAVLLLPMIVANLCMSSTSKMFIYKKNHVGLIWQLCFFTGLATSIIIGGTFGTPYIAAGLYSAFGTIMYFIHLCLTLKYAGGSWTNLFRIRTA